MAYREASRMETAGVIRRWQAGSGPQQISSGAALSRNTARKCLSAARAMEERVGRINQIPDLGVAETP